MDASVKKEIQDHKNWLKSGGKRGRRLVVTSLTSYRFRGETFTDADLRRAHIHGALYGVVFKNCNLFGAELNTYDVTFKNCRLPVTCVTREYFIKNNKFDAKTAKQLVLPAHMKHPEGKLIGYKKVQLQNYKYIAVLEIPARARRIRAWNSPDAKHRASCAKVVRLEELSGKLTSIKTAYSMRTGNNNKYLAYKVGEMVKPDKFDPNPMDTCSHGIHFFLTRREAVNY